MKLLVGIILCVVLLATSVFAGMDCSTTCAQANSCFTPTDICQCDKSTLPPEKQLYFDQFCVPHVPHIPPNQIPEFPLAGGAAIPFGFGIIGYLLIRRRVQKK
jgi:hypothetical protein